MIQQKLDLIIFIDDDIATNFLHQRSADHAECAKEVKTFLSAVDALEYLKNDKSEDYVRPNLIFLDINMPVMNGWEFIEEYEKLNESQKSDFVLVMLTTSLNPLDKIKAKELNLISDFENKPLTSDGLINIVKTHFPEKFNADLALS
jgi:CheY-like chemotaxis protein